MKKTITILIVLSILMTCIIGNALADDFSIRNGIRFGMSMQDVKQAEKAVGTADPREGFDLLYYDHADIAGMDAFIGYYFFNDYKLTGIDYRFNSDVQWVSDVKSQSEREALYEQVKKIYDTLDEVLSSKYEQIGNKEGENSIKYVHFEQPNSFQGEFYYPFFKLSDGKISVEADSTRFFDLYGFKQYIAPDGDDFVEIVIVCFHWENLGNLYIDTRVKYRRISKEIMESTINAAQEQKDKKNSDL